ncbi:MAG: ABC transporter ATP-binding protein [Candidatus Promineifilaceae bacterium]
MTILKVDRISKAFHKDGVTVHAIRDVSLNVDAGEVLAFLGPNGAGKTTAIKMMAGLIYPDSGGVLIEGESPANHSVLRKVGAVLEGNRNLYWRLTVKENLEYFGVLRGMPFDKTAQRATELIECFGLGDKTNSIALHLSRGMQQKLSIAVALMHDPKLLLLDEPTLALDVQAVEDMIALIRTISKEGKAILITTHQLDIAQKVATRVAMIQSGRVMVEDTPTNLISAYSSGIYSIYLDQPIPTDVSHQLRALGAELYGETVIVKTGVSALYACLEHLKPIPIQRIERDSADLEYIFREVTKTNHESSTSR